MKKKTKPKLPSALLQHQRNLEMELDIKIRQMKTGQIEITFDEIDNIIVMIGSENRMAFGLKLLNFLKGKHYWYALRNSYDSGDDLYEYRKRIKIAFLSKEPFRETLMEEDERKYLESLPDKLTIYRGMTLQEKEQSSFGCSWSLKKEVAEFFAFTYGRNYATQHLEKVVHLLSIDKTDAIAYLGGRNEFE